MRSATGEAMKCSLIDTDILSLFFRGNRKVRANFAAYLSEYDEINFSIVSYYEIISGLKHRDARKQMDSFVEFASQNNILPLTIESTTESAEIYATLRKKGTPVDDIDLLIAGIALKNSLVMVTNNINHFTRINGLIVENWST
jgi:tRNA(fMet)-specific endonuclease VapC